MQPSAVPSSRDSAARVPHDLKWQAQRIVRISRVVSELGRSESFYRSALGFRTVSRGPVDPAVLRAVGGEAMGANEVLMRLGEEEIALVQFAEPSRGYPLDSRSNDLWFQHLAIVVSDMEAAFAHLSSSDAWQPISNAGPQTLPASNGGVRAFKFRDPDGHPLELLWLPPGFGRTVWQRPRSPSTQASLFIGIDHSALSVRSTRRSVAFYGALGMRIGDRSLNRGPAQSRLDGLRAARVRVTGLRPVSAEGPGLELLAYRPPGRAQGSASVTDVATDWVTLDAGPCAAVAPCAAVGPCASAAPSVTVVPRAIADPDGHRLVLLAQGVGTIGRPA